MSNDSIDTWTNTETGESVKLPSLEELSKIAKEAKPDYLENELERARKMLKEQAAEIERLKRDRDAAIKEIGIQARKVGYLEHDLEQIKAEFLSNEPALAKRIHAEQQAEIERLKRELSDALVWKKRLDEAAEIVEKQEQEIERLKELLDESFKLQTHSAKLLNMHDGGERIVFDSIEQFEERLKFVKENYRKAAKDVAKKESEGE